MYKTLKSKKEDDIPLMNQNVGGVNDDECDEDGDEKQFKKHDITLWLSDAVVLVVEHLQYYAVLLALSEHWGWPLSWVKITAFTLIFNFDIWEFRIVETGLFDHSSADNSFIDSKKLGFNYVSYLAAWAVLLFITAGIFGAVYLQWMRRRPLHLLVYLARWKRVMFMVLQILAVPFGIVAARIFHCRAEVYGRVVMDVQNEFRCYDGIHITLMTLVLIIFVLLYLLYPFILSRWVNEQVFSNDPLRHEGYIQLKEAEYEQGLDVLWEVGQYHLFSSFRRAWTFYNPLKFIFKLLLIVAFASSVKSKFWSSAAITILFCIATIALMLRRPFRVRCFNIMIIFSHLVLSANALIGNFMVRPPWEKPEKFQIVAFLRVPTIEHILLAFNATWLLLLILWAFYLFLLSNGVFSNARIWPRLSYDSSSNIGDDTKRYLKAALKARRILESALSAIPMFAPIHELSHQVQVINAYCREAEYLKDPTHDTLCDLLDELIDAHNTLAPISVFGLSGKNSIKETSEAFIKLMPSFKKRLRQREYDFILVPPLKRRLLLKMYILSVFIGNAKKLSRPDDDVKNKLKEALAMFDTRSIDEYDTGFSSEPSSSAASSRPMTSVLNDYTGGRETNMTQFLEEVDGIVKNPSLELEKRYSSQNSSFLSDRLSNEKSHLNSRGKQKKNSLKDSFVRGNTWEKDSFSTLSEGVASEKFYPSPPHQETVPLSPLVRQDNSRPQEYVKVSTDMSSTASIPSQVDEENANTQNYNESYA